MTLRIMSLSKATLSIMTLNNVTANQHSVSNLMALYVAFSFCYADCRYASYLWQKLGTKFDLFQGGKVVHNGWNQFYT
jgi:hypothetical protein